MTTPCDCACGEARAKVEAVVISLRVMRAGLEALEEQIDQTLATAETELKQASERACPENPVLPAPAGESAPQGSAEADIASHDMAASEGLVDPAVAETADCPPDVGVQRANGTPIVEQKAALFADSGTNSHLPVTAGPPNEERAGEDPMPTEVAGVKDGPSTSCNDGTETESPLEPVDGNIGDHKVEPQSSEGAAPPAAGDDVDRTIADYTKAIALDPNFAAAYTNRGNAYGDKGEVESTIRGSNIVTLARRGRRMLRNVAPSIAASLAPVGTVVATKFDTLFTSLARATGLR